MHKHSKGYQNTNYISCTWKLVLFRPASKALPVPGEETERTELNSLPGFAETASATKCNLKSTATHLLTRYKTRISVLLRVSRDKFTVPVFYAASKRHCIWKRQCKSNSCAPKSLSRLRFFIPIGACCLPCCWGTGSLLLVLRRTVSCAAHSSEAHTVPIRLLLAERGQYGTVLVSPWEFPA